MQPLPALKAAKKRVALDWLMSKQLDTFRFNISPYSDSPPIFSKRQKKKKLGQAHGSSNWVLLIKIVPLVAVFSYAHSLNA